ncbi:phosphoribosylformylglycinamidine cyclo-ligase [Thermosediminibacter oceani]|uniref:Phosphoribosylformylglycinamidine cyclo-ligase n=1 Tax=Thermosediminibacter oceani (strain ATCC BAA-1034 / DSM 16646 / JW/IW-1228P) TaxID=555079 RepID=D9RY25_THEOJ|nr:phosphoribosylformylglycinamidine cyclo-ligase [Thermosediminibacter oceani]ADL08249.1 phosphoribosylformylglycinamidine cyclo-ligase [Thermosediminibacter oceani DSM 16646]
MDEKMTYREAGVDVDEGNRAVKLIKPQIESTHRCGVLGDIGGFGGFFELDVGKYRRPVLVSGADGVGTKLKIAFMMDKHDTVGIDCVAMCVNDILVHGAEPLFFLDYIATGRLEPEKIADIVKGVAQGCREAGCALIGGETAEMPGFYGDNEYDLAGFAVGVVNKDRIIDGSKIKEKDIVLGIASSGLHSNGYSLARKILFDRGGLTVNTYIDELGRTVGEELLTPTRIYAAIVRELEGLEIHGMAHITGGGFIDNLPRILPGGLEFRINEGSWDIPPVFSILQKMGNVEKAEMYRTFNMGIGFVVVAPEEEADKVIKLCRNRGLKAWNIGEICRGEGGVVFCRR